MTQACFIGIDQGSSSTKAIAVSRDGQVLFQAKRALPPPSGEAGRIEHPASTILSDVRELLAEALQALQAAGFSAAAVGLSCQRSSCLVWDELSGEPLSPVISWRDTRGRELVEQLRNQAVSIFETTGLPLTPHYSASKLRWLRDNIPASAKETSVMGTLSCFLAQALTREKRAVIDHTQAARTQLMNIRTLAWDPNLLERFGVSGVRLPEIAPVVHEYGTIATTAGSVPLRVCIGDQQAAMVGLGVLEPGEGGINYGTGGFLIVNTGSEPVAAKGLMTSIHYSTGRTRYYVLEGSVNAAGHALEWLRSGMRLFTDYEDLDDLCWQAASDVVAFVGLNGTGAPHWEQGISSSIHGLRQESTAADIIRGTVEGIAFFMKEIEQEISAAGVRTGGFSVSGGLSSLSYLVQVQADILQKDLRVSPQQEVSTLGAALLAGLADGVWTVAELKKMLQPAETISPRRNPGAEKRYRRWKELHRMTRNLDEI